MKNHSKLFAAVDLGSNSFHMVIAQYDGRSFHLIGKHKEKIQLASGLDKNNQLSEKAIQRGLDCLSLFAERLKDIPAKQIKIVGTYTLRKAKNADDFIQRASEVLSHTIEILPGSEEARLIYNGVSHNHPDIERALVIDIGGGSTEIILGDKFEPISLDSLSLGCITYSRYFPNNKITYKNFERALLNAKLDLSPVIKRYLSHNWQHCLGSSGSIEAIYKVVEGFGYKDGVILLSHLKLLQQKLIEIGDIEDINLEGLSKSRVSTFTSGLVILIALFEEFKIPKLYFSNASLREGILLELAQELQGNDIRNKTVSSMLRRLNIDHHYANQVKATAQLIFDEVSDLWAIYDPSYKNLLDWSCLLHEAGLSISFSKMKEHSAYIVRYADMPGFSQQTKDSLAEIISAQSKKFNPENFGHKYEPAQALLAISQILRLAILFNIKRDQPDISQLKFVAQSDNQVIIKIPKAWAEQHQLLIFELEKEQKYLAHHKINLTTKLV